MGGVVLAAGHPRYTKIEDLNSGGFGFVQLCYDLATGHKARNRGSLMLCMPFPIVSNHGITFAYPLPPVTPCRGIDLFPRIAHLCASTEYLCREILAWLSVVGL